MTCIASGPHGRKRSSKIRCCDKESETGLSEKLRDCKKVLTPSTVKLGIKAFFLLRCPKGSVIKGTISFFLPSYSV